MSRTVNKHKTWLIPLCILIAAIVFFVGLQRIQAQAPPGVPGGPPGAGGPPGVTAPPPAAGGMPGMAPTGTASAGASAEPVLKLTAVMPAHFDTVQIKNFDHTVTRFYRFKFKTSSDTVITVHLPVSYGKQTMTKSAWSTLFQAFGMDVEAKMDAEEASRPIDPMTSVSQLMAELTAKEGNQVAPAGLLNGPSGMPFDIGSMMNIGSGGGSAPMALPSLPSIPSL